jgi:hypothetical protein
MQTPNKHLVHVTTCNGKVAVIRAVRMFNPIIRLGEAKKVADAVVKPSLGTKDEITWRLIVTDADLGRYFHQKTTRHFDDIPIIEIEIDNTYLHAYDLESLTCL